MLLLSITAYRRRRGWLAWHTALLMRGDFSEFPTLAALCGEAGARDRAEQSDDVMAHNLRLWTAVLDQKAS